LARHREWLLVAVLTVLALVLRLALAGQSLGPDELFTYGYTVDQSLGDVLEADNENNPPLFYVMAWLSVKAGNATFSIRLASVLLGAATVPVVYALGARTVGRPAGLIGATIVAIAPFSVFYGTEARAYSALMFFAALSTLALLVAIESRRRWHWALYALASCAVLYTHYLGGLVLTAQAVWALVAHRQVLGALLASNAAAALGCLPLLPSLLGPRSLPAPDAAPSVATVWEQTLRLFPGHPLLSTSDLPGLMAMLAVAAALALGLVGLALRPHRPAAVTLFALIVVTTFVGFLFYTIAGEAYFLARYLGVALPAFALLIGALITSGPRVVGVASVSLLLLGLLVGAVRMFEDPNQRPDYKGAAELVEREARRGDIVVDPEVSRTITYRAFLPVLGTARQTQLSVNLEDHDEILGASTLLDAVNRVGVGRRIFVLEPKGLVESPVGLPVRPLGRATFDGVEPIRVLTYQRVAGVDRRSGRTQVEIPDQVDVRAMRKCLRGRGLDVEFADSFPGTVTLRYDLGRRGAGLVVLFGSVDAARASVEGIQSILGTHGGKAESAGKTVVGFTEPPTERDRKTVAGCL
jgi:hypothetical protein